jgi:hypothetical protein
LRRRLDAVELDQRHGLPCVPPVRAVLDEVHRIGELREAVVVLDMALVARLVTFPELDAFIASHAGLPGVRLMRSARRLASDRSRSPMETRMRLIWVLDAGLPTPRCNWPIADANGRWLGSPDLICHEVAVFGEFDGAGHRERDQHRTDVERDDLFRRTGLEGRSGRVRPRRRAPRGGPHAGCCPARSRFAAALALAAQGEPQAAVALRRACQRTSSRSTTKISVSPGLMAPPAPRSP